MKKLSCFITILLICVNVSAQMVNPVKWKFASKQIDAQTIELQFNASIDKGWHLYGLKEYDGGEDGVAPQPTRFVFEKKTGASLQGKVVGVSKLIEEYDKIFEMTVGFYSTTAVFTQKVQIDAAKGYKIEGYIKYQSCNDIACVSDETPFVFEQNGDKNALASAATTEPDENDDTTTELAVEPVPADDTNIAAVDIFSPVIDKVAEFNRQTGSSSNTAERSLWWVFLIGLGCGLLALITPCVFPIIPMTVSFFLKRSENKARARKDAILYGLSIVLIYVAVGLLITLIFGTNALNALSTNAVFNLFLFALLVVFAMSFFGMFEITLPSSWSSKLDAKASNTTGFVSIFFMAFVLVIVSFSCTGPIIGGMLVNISNGEFLVPIVVMLGFSIALAIPFGFFAFFPTLLKSLPKSGGWLNTVKVVLAFVELAFALKFLSVADLAYGWHILDRETFIVLWIVLFALLGMYFLGKLRFPHDDEQEHVSVPKFFMGWLAIAFAVYMIPGLWGAPLKAISAFAPPMNTQDFTLYENHLEAQYSDYELGMAAAKIQKKPVVIDFSGFGCVNCRKMEAAEWTKDKVFETLTKDYILISLMVDDKTPLPEIQEVTINGIKRKLRTLGDKYSYIQQHKFAFNAQPYYVILDENGEPLAGSFTYEDLKKGKDFEEFLHFGLENYKKQKSNK